MGPSYSLCFQADPGVAAEIEMAPEEMAQKTVPSKGTGEKIHRVSAESQHFPMLSDCYPIVDILYP